MITQCPIFFWRVAMGLNVRLNIGLAVSDCLGAYSNESRSSAKARSVVLAAPVGERFWFEV